MTERRFFTSLAQQLSTRGVTDVLRKGFRFLELFDMYYPLPSKLNPTAQELYSKNIFCVTEELVYSQQNDNRIDLMVSINGLPLITMELKNHILIAEWSREKKMESKIMLTSDWNGVFRERKLKMSVTKKWHILLWH